MKTRGYEAHLQAIYANYAKPEPYRDPPKPFAEVFPKTKG